MSFCSFHKNIWSGREKELERGFEERRLWEARGE
jgi:hypothetical protein